jgi:glycosyltransferase involved in cell wall biosynthesis
VTGIEQSRREARLHTSASTAAIAPGHTLLYLPWEFDLLAGVDVAVDRLYGFLDRAGPGSVTIGLQDWHRSGLEVDAVGRRFLRLNLPQPPSAAGVAGVLPWLRYLLTLARRVPGIAATLRRHRIATVNVHYVTTNAFVLALAKTLGLWRGRIVLSFHGSDALTVDECSPVWKLIGTVADAVVACSEPLRRELVGMNLFRAPVTVIHNGVDAARLVEQLGQCGEPALPKTFDRYLLCVGMYRDVKGQDVLLHAFARLTAVRPKLGLVFAGATDNGEWLRQLKVLAENLAVADRVVFLENLPHAQIVALMRRAACFVSASRREGFALVLLEAGALGVPIVATRVGGAPELMPSPDYGWLVPPEDDHALEAAVSELLDRRDEAVYRGALLQQRVADHFSLNATGSAYARLIS